MYRLQYLNIVVETESEMQKEHLMAQGYTLLDQQDNEKDSDESQKTEEEIKSYKKKTTEELREIAREKGIEQVQNLTKKELLSLLEGE